MSQKGLSKFHALRPPAISIKDYLQRVAKYAACSGECFVLALVYIDRIIQSNPTFVVNSLNIHRLLITSIMLAAKFFDDQVRTHTEAPHSGGAQIRCIPSRPISLRINVWLSRQLPSFRHAFGVRSFRRNAVMRCAACPRVSVAQCVPACGHSLLFFPFFSISITLITPRLVVSLAMRSTVWRLSSCSCGELGGNNNTVGWAE